MTTHLNPTAAEKWIVNIKFSVEQQRLTIWSAIKGGLGESQEGEIGKDYHCGWKPGKEDIFRCSGVITLEILKG